MATNMNEANHQHTVPVCYLANFGIEGNKKRRSVVHFYNIPDDKISVTGVEAFPIENNFYDIEALGEHKQIIEKLFEDIERSDLSRLLKELLRLVVIAPNERKEQGVQLSIDQKSQLAGQIAMLAIRTRAFRDHYKDFYQQIKDCPPFAGIPQYDETDYQRLHTTEILSFRTSNFYANLFDDRHWVFLINHTGTPFVTSDNPAILIDHRKEKSMPISPVSEEATFYVPISPTVAIQIYDKKVLKNDLGYFDIYQEKHIRWYNDQIINNCTRFIFSNKDLADVRSEVTGNE